MRSVVRVHLGPPIFRSSCLFKASYAHSTLRLLKDIICEKLPIRQIKAFSFSELWKGNDRSTRKRKARRGGFDSAAFSEQGKARKTILSVCRGALTKLWKGIDRSTKLYGGVAQLGEHLPCKQGVRSSILLISTIRGKLPRKDIFKCCTLKTK